MNCPNCGANQNQENAFSMLRNENQRLAEELALALQELRDERMRNAALVTDLTRLNMRTSQDQATLRALASSPPMDLLRRLVHHQMDHSQLMAELTAMMRGMVS